MTCALTFRVRGKAAPNRRNPGFRSRIMASTAESRIKDIWMYPLRRNFREILRR